MSELSSIFARVPGQPALRVLGRFVDGIDATLLPLATEEVQCCCTCQPLSQGLN